MMRRLQLQFVIFAVLWICAGTAAFAQQTTSFSYDPLGRLNGVSQSGGPTSGTVATYSYDPAGNRTTYNAQLNAGLSIAAATANEGSNLVFTVTRTGTTVNPVTVNYATSNGTAISGVNYTSTSGTLSFASGVTSLTIMVPTIDDHAYTQGLGMTVTLSGPSAGGVINNATAAGTINNIDGAPTFSIASAASSEGTPLAFVVTRTGTQANAVSVNYSTSNGTAVAGTNYGAASGTLSFGSGVATQTITVPTIDDHFYSGSLGLTVALSAPSGGAVIATGSAAGTINNIDVQPVLSIVAASANEGSPLSFVVTRTGTTANPVGVSYATSNGTATAGTNYSTTSGTLSFAAGVTTQTVSVPTLSTSSQIANLTMNVALSAPTGGAAIGISSATGTIKFVQGPWSTTLTAGSLSPCPQGFCHYTSGYGPAIGSLSSATYGSYTITTIEALYSDGTTSGSVVFTESGSTAPPNSGWTSIAIPGAGTLNRASATYTVSGTTATWTWTTGTLTIISGTVTIL